jgi:hypothetical protein
MLICELEGSGSAWHSDDKETSKLSFMVGMREALAGDEASSERARNIVMVRYLFLPLWTRRLSSYVSVRSSPPPLPRNRLRKGEISRSERY